MPMPAVLTPGGTYVLDDYTFVQVAALYEGHVRYRMRGRAWAWRSRPRVVERSAPVNDLLQRIRAEVDGGFFPDFVVTGPHRFRHPAAEVSCLRRHLAERAAERPFAASR